jgi:hypothetical protein
MSFILYREKRALVLSEVDREWSWFVSVFGTCTYPKTKDDRVC